MEPTSPAFDSHAPAPPTILTSPFFVASVIHPLVAQTLNAPLFPANELAQLLGTQEAVFDLAPLSSEIPALLPEGQDALAEAIRALNLQLALPQEDAASSSSAALREVEDAQLVGIDRRQQKALKEAKTRLQLAGCHLLLHDVVRAESELHLARSLLRPPPPTRAPTQDEPPYSSAKATSATLALERRQELTIRVLRLLQLAADMQGKTDEAHRFGRWIEQGLRRLENLHEKKAGRAAPGPTGSKHNKPKSEVPDVPGDLVDEMRARSLRQKVASLCHLSHMRFPGAQPVSFNKGSLDLLKGEDFWVCEKSDGQRVLVFIALNKMMRRQEVFLIDRKNNYREQHHIFFPHHEKPLPDSVTYGPFRVRYDTLLDGELVWDTDASGKRTLRLLLFDCIVMDGESMASRPLGKRYGRLRSLLWPPYDAYLRQHPQVAAMVPFQLKIKPMELSYGIRSVINDKIPMLEHGNDGLIFTCINSGYTSGTDPKIIKWKPPSENTVDFKLRLRFPPDLARDPQGRLPDLSAKPFFQLDQYVGRGSGSDDGYEMFDWLHVEDDEWEEMKASGQQFDDRIVECSWVPHGGPLPLEQERKLRQRRAERRAARVAERWARATGVTLNGAHASSGDGDAEMHDVGGADPDVGPRRGGQGTGDNGGDGQEEEDEVCWAELEELGGTAEGDLDDDAAREEAELERRRPPAWRLHRIRDDKTDGNHASIVVKILQSIMDGVEEDELVAAEETIRSAWKSAQRTDLRNRIMAPGAPPPSSILGNAGAAASATTTSSSSSFPSSASSAVAPASGPTTMASAAAAPPSSLAAAMHCEAVVFSRTPHGSRGRPLALRGRPPAWLSRR